MKGSKDRLELIRSDSNAVVLNFDEQGQWIFDSMIAVWFLAGQGCWFESSAL
jgi:hypothetical protein